jgi:hypothetical protein
MQQCPLMTVSPSADDLVGEQVRSAHCEERVVVISTTAYEIRVDLQRTRCVTWLEKRRCLAAIERSASFHRGQLLSDNGSRLGFTEPAKTKRVAVSLLPGSC